MNIITKFFIYAVLAGTAPYYHAMEYPDKNNTKKDTAPITVIIGDTKFKDIPRHQLFHLKTLEDMLTDIPSTTVHLDDISAADFQRLLFIAQILSDPAIEEKEDSIEEYINTLSPEKHLAVLNYIHYFNMSLVKPIILKNLPQKMVLDAKELMSYLHSPENYSAQFSYSNELEKKLTRKLLMLPPFYMSQEMRYDISHYHKKFFMITRRKLLSTNNGLMIFSCSDECSTDKPLSLLEVLLLHAIRHPKINFTYISPQEKLTAIFESLMEKIKSSTELCSLVSAAFTAYRSVPAINTISSINHT